MLGCSWRSARSARSVPLSVLAAVLVVVGLLTPWPAGAATTAWPTPTVPDYGASIDPTPYEAETTTCSPSYKLGVQRVMSLISATYPTQDTFGPPRCESGSSGHNEGRAFDWMLSARDASQKQLADTFTAWLIANDKYGNTGAMARRLGVMYVIWNGRMWRSYKPGWTEYSKCLTTMTASTYDNTCHRTHVHLSFTYEGAYAQTSYYTTGSLAVGSDGLVTLTGSGYGHGIGLSQYGARARAAAGASRDAILGFYYPGTVGGTTPNRTVRVKLLTTNAASSGYVKAAPDPGLGVWLPGHGWTLLPAGVRSDGSGASCTPGTAGCAAVNVYRLYHSGGAPGTWLLQGWYTGQGPGRSTSWTGYQPLFPTGSALNAPLPAAGNPAVFDNLSAAQRRGASDDAGDHTVPVVLASYSTLRYRGQLAVLAPNAKRSEVLARNDVPLESYLRGVVPAEMPSSWPAAALQAQAVAARSYAVSTTASRTSWEYDVVPTTADQVYGGIPVEVAATDNAVAATAGQVRTYSGSVAWTQFSSSNGGWSAPGSKPYLAARQDTSDPRTPYVVTMDTGKVAARYGLGTVSRVTVTTRDGAGAWGGRVTGITFTGSAKSVTLSGAALQGIVGLRSTLFTLVTPPASA